MRDAIITGLSTRRRRPAQNLGAWDCPTCGAENTGPLEHGCPTCLAGADARRKGQPPKARPSATSPTATHKTFEIEAALSSILESIPDYHAAIARLLDGDGTEGEPNSPDVEAAQDAYAVWRDSMKRIALKPEELVRAAFMGGVVWQREEQEAHGGSVVAADPVRPTHADGGRGAKASPPTADPETPAATVETGDGLQLQIGDTYADAKTLQTILAALAFYRDNQLAYGEAEGQLTADQVTDLIYQLLPAGEPPASGEPTP